VGEAKRRKLVKARGDFVEFRDRITGELVEGRAAGSPHTHVLDTAIA
jgi:hypothetical protein